MSRIFGPKTLDITQANVFTYDFVFDYADFSKNTTTKLEGPLSLAVDVNNPTYRLCYIGVIVETDDAITTTFDRYNLAFCPGLTQITVSAASVPSLAAIRGIIKKITVRLFCFVQTVPSSSNKATVYLRVDDPLPFVSPTPLIGRDMQSIQPGVYQTDRYQFANPNYPGLTIPANTPTTQKILAYTQYHTDSNLWRFRVHIVSAYIVIEPTPFPGDVIVEVHYLDAAMALSNLFVSPIATVFSKVDEFQSIHIPFGFVILGTEAFGIVAYNRNQYRAGKAAAQLFVETIY